MEEKRSSSFQFSIPQLLWGIVLMAIWLCCVRVSLTVDIRQPPEPDWGITLLATPPIAGGLAGLFLNKTKGMLIGIAVGGLLLVLVLSFLLPSVH